MLTKLQRQVLEISFRHKRSHIGSCLGALPLLEEIYTLRNPDEPVILSAGHAGLALYCVLEKFCGANAEDLLGRHGVHPTKSAADGIYCTTGSLGQGISTAVGRALADRKRNVWCYVTDGECAEGVVGESLRFISRHDLSNLRLYVNWNGYGAYRTTEGPGTLFRGVNAVVRQIKLEELGIPFLKGLNAHYYTMSEADWAWVQEQEVV